MGTTAAHKSNGMPASRIKRRSVPAAAAPPVQLSVPPIETVLELAGHLSRSEMACSRFADWLECQGPVDPMYIERQQAAARQFREWLLHHAWQDGH